MIKLTVLPHTADVRIRVEADTLEELFEGALRGMANLLKEGSCEGEAEEVPAQELAVKSVDITALLIDFLSQVLVLSFEQQAVYCSLTLHHLNPTTLSGCLYGRKVNAFEEDIKAVTYHEANVHQNSRGKWKTVLVFDI